jgi:hypothetical protein
MNTMAVTPSHSTQVTLYLPLGTAQCQPLLAEGVAFLEETSHLREAVADRLALIVMLHGVTYPQVHVNGLKKKKKTCWFPVGCMVTAVVVVET